MKKLTRRETRVIEAEAFRDGTQDVDAGPAVEEINASFARRKEEENLKSAERIKSLEARVEHLGPRARDAEKHWGGLESLTGGMPPQVILPLCAVLFSAAVVVGESVFLAPVMDGFGIADPVWQYLLAAVIVITCSGLVEVTKKQWTRTRDGAEAAPAARTNGPARWVRGAFSGFLALLALLLVSVLGWWRAQEMMFAASEQSGAWRQFLSENSTLTRVVVMLLTTSLPVFVALAFEWGLDGLRLAREWRKARRERRRTTALLEKTRKALEAEREMKESRLKALDELREEWRHAYLQNHELGRKVGARRLPLWRVLLKIGAVGFVLLAVCVFADPLVSGYITSGFARVLLYACVTAGLGGAYAAYAVKCWDRPTALQLYKQQATLWREEGGGETPPAQQPGPTRLNGNGAHHLPQPLEAGRRLSAQ